MKNKIIIDTDPGQDDAVAILLALASQDEIDVLGIVAVAGNVGLAQNAKNARKVVELSGRTQTPIYAGCERPMVRRLVTAEHVHGDTGLNGPNLPEPTIELKTQHGVDFIIETLMNEPMGSVTICALGPLTNIAMAMIKSPGIIRRIRKIVMMGGAYFEVGNITPAAEFNIYVDPHAADVLSRDESNEAFEVYLRMALYLRPDLAPARMLLGDLFEGRHINVTIETQSELTMGMTVADYWGVTGKVKNCTYLRNANSTGFYKLLTERLARLP